MPLSGVVISHAGARRTVAVMSVVLAIGLAVVAAGYLSGLALVVVGLFTLGLGNGTWDVAMNVHGGAVERQLGRSIMPRFHAAWSLGTVIGAGIGAIAVALSVPVSAHLGAVAVVVALAIPPSTRWFLPDVDGSPAGGDEDEVPAPSRQRARNALSAWREPRTIAIGAFVLAFAFAEGTANDWTSVAAIEGYHLPAALGTLTFATFLAAMTIGRWTSPVLVDRYGRVLVSRSLALIAIAGVALFVFGPSVPFAFVGALLWGAGASVGFPLGMSAGGDDPVRAPGRVSVIASVGYCAFLAGPPFVGFLGNHFTVLRALIAVAALLAIAIVLAPTLRPPRVSAPVDPAGA